MQFRSCVASRLGFEYGFTFSFNLFFCRNYLNESLTWRAFALVSFNEGFQNLRHLTLVRQLIVRDNLSAKALETQEPADKRNVETFEFHDFIPKLTV